MVASTIVPRLMRMPRLSRYSLTACNIAPPRSCFSSRWRNCKIVLSSGAGARPKSTPAKGRSAGDSYSASSAPGSDRLNHCCKEYTRSIIDKPPAAAHSLLWDSVVRSTLVTPPTGCSAPSLRETAPASTYAGTSRIRSAPPESVVALVFSLRLTHYPRKLWIGEYFRGSLGPPGTGKSHLAQAIGQAAIQQGYRVLYRETHKLLDDLSEATIDGTCKEHMELLASVPLLIIDDLGIRKLPVTVAEELLEIVMRRYERASTLLTSNRPVEDWGKLLGDSAAVTAMLDRLLHHGHVLKCGPRSWRTKTDLPPQEAAG